ncbi:DUF6507 family protein [Citricoccus sp. GCM10030269]|uniref:DUF6507 family protein n=1 Tax=Citricoccus sp. GCM10030269 TaxID=3273388 RepID=UPI003606409E
MSLTGYDIDPAGARGVVNRVETQAEDLPTIRETAHGHMESLIEAAKMRAVTTALTSVWNDMLAVQAEAAEVRIANGNSGMRSAVTAFEDGDINMMEASHATMHQSPDLEIDDAMVVEDE